MIWAGRQTGPNQGREGRAHGTSFYYRDPDGNVVELSGADFESETEYFAYLESETFKRNISDVAIDADDFVAKYRNGTSQQDLVKIA